MESVLQIIAGIRFFPFLSDIWFIWFFSLFSAHWKCLINLKIVHDWVLTPKMEQPNLCVKVTSDDLGQQLVCFISLRYCIVIFHLCASILNCASFFVGTNPDAPSFNQIADSFKFPQKITGFSEVNRGQSWCFFVKARWFYLSQWHWCGGK